MKNRFKYHTYWSRMATVYPVGFIPKAPGTWGTIAGWPLAFGGQWVFLHYKWLGLGFFLVGTLLAYVAIAKTEALWSCHDDGRIVIDEVLGLWLTYLFCGPSWQALLLGFVLFRVFDIFKPGPIGWIDRHLPGAWGTLMDDLAAGLAAGACVWLLL